MEAAEHADPDIRLLHQLLRVAQSNHYDIYSFLDYYCVPPRTREESLELFNSFLERAERIAQERGAFHALNWFIETAFPLGRSIDLEHRKTLQARRRAFMRNLH